MISKKIDHAFIMAAGRGTRLMPLTKKIPKGLIKFKQSSLISNGINKLKKYINWMLAIIVASIGVYNWCFIMFYRNEGNIRVNVWNVPRDNIKKRASSNPFFSFIELFTDIPLFFTDFFKKYIIDWIPDTIMSKIDDPRSQKSYDAVLISLFMFILTASVFMVNGSGEAIKNIIVDLAKFEFKGTVIYIHYGQSKEYQYCLNPDCFRRQN